MLFGENIRNFIGQFWYDRINIIFIIHQEILLIPFRDDHNFPLPPYLKKCGDRFINWTNLFNPGGQMLQFIYLFFSINTFARTQGFEWHSWFAIVCHVVSVDVCSKVSLMAALQLECLSESHYLLQVTLLQNAEVQSMLPHFLHLPCTLSLYYS